MTDRLPRLVQRSEWASDPTLWKGRIEGRSLGTNVTILFYSTEEVGRGPVLHVHLYDETFVIREGVRCLRSAKPGSRRRRGRSSSLPRTFHTSFAISAPGAWTPQTSTSATVGSRPISMILGLNPDAAKR